MRRHRLVHRDARPGACLSLEASDLHHLAHVLRAGSGAEVEVLDGHGSAYLARFVGLEPPQLRIEGELAAPPAAEPVVVCLALLRSSRVDWAIEKLSELGVDRVVLIQSQRAEGRPRLERWARIAGESAKQCGRGELLQLAEAGSVVAALQTLPVGGTRLLLDPNGEPLDVTDLVAPVVLAVGPEGGFTAVEVAAYQAADFRRIRIAAPILRAETAAIAAAALVIGLRQRRG